VLVLEGVPSVGSPSKEKNSGQAGLAESGVILKSADGRKDEGRQGEKQEIERARDGALSPLAAEGAKASGVATAVTNRERKEEIDQMLGTRADLFSESSANISSSSSSSSSSSLCTDCWLCPT